MQVVFVARTLFALAFSSKNPSRVLGMQQVALCVNDDETAILQRFRVEGAKGKSHGHPQPYGAIAFDS
jgi:hypothetical protein